MKTTVQRTDRVSDYPTSDRVSAHVARELGLAEGSAKMELYGERRANQRAARVLRALTRSGDRAAFAHYSAPLIAALREIPISPLTPLLELQAQTADMDEELAEKAYDKNPCPATAAALVRAKDIAITLELEARMAIAAKWDLT